MKCVCISCFDYYEIRTQKVIRFLNDKGYQVSYFYADFNHYEKKYCDISQKHGEIIHVPKYGKNISVSRLYSHYCFSKKIRKFLDKIEPDLIYCMIPPNTLVYQIAEYKREKKVKVIFDCYDLWPESFPYNHRVLQMPFKYWGKLRKDYIKSADLIIAVSEQEKKVLEIEAEGVPIKIFRPVLEKKIQPNYSADLKDGITFCYLGMINHITDIQLAINLLSNIKKYMNVTLHIIGKGQNLNQLVEELETRQVTVINHGVVFDIKEKNMIFSQCNMGLNIPRKEIDSTMSLKAIEYLRAGLPVLNSASGDIKKIIQEYEVGINIQSENMEKTLLEIEKLSSEKLTRMHNQCSAAYSEKFIDQDLEELFSDVI